MILLTSSGRGHFWSINHSTTLSQLYGGVWEANKGMIPAFSYAFIEGLLLFFFLFRVYGFFRRCTARRREMCCYTIFMKTPLSIDTYVLFMGEYFMKIEKCKDS